MNGSSCLEASAKGLADLDPAEEPEHPRANEMSFSNCVGSVSDGHRRVIGEMLEDSESAELGLAAAELGLTEQFVETADRGRPSDVKQSNGSPDPVFDKDDTLCL